MTINRKVTKEEAIAANIYVHAFLADAGEYQKSPHFLPENKERVRAKLKELAAPLAGMHRSSVVDFGCGTGFLIDLMKDLFSEVHGVDITPAMMNRVDLSSGNIRLHECLAEKTPFADDHFDFATAYSFMDHLYDYREFLGEVFRVLKRGGIFYADLNPNRDFIAAMDRISNTRNTDLSAVIVREIQGALHNGDHYEKQFGIDGAMLEVAEPGKSFEKGFDSQEVVDAARLIGFSDCKVEFQWFLGQAKVTHEQSKEHAAVVDDYLTSVLPLTSPFYKYLRFVFVK